LKLFVLFIRNNLNQVVHTLFTVCTTWLRLFLHHAGYSNGIMSLVRHSILRQSLLRHLLLRRCTLIYRPDSIWRWCDDIRNFVRFLLNSELLKVILSSGETSRKIVFSSINSFKFYISSQFTIRTCVPIYGPLMPMCF
jgi:hypothetical protein